MRSRRDVVTVVTVVALATFIGGAIGTVVGTVAVAIQLRYGSRLTSLMAGVALALAAFATVIQVQLTEGYSLGFATNRPLASALGLVSVLFVLAMTVDDIRHTPQTHRRREPSTRSARAPVIARGLRQRSRPRHLRKSSRLLTLGRALLVTGFVSIAVALRVNAAQPIPNGYTSVINNLRAGLGFTTGTGLGLRPSSLYPPVIPLIGAFAPLPPSLFLGIASLMGAVITGLLARRLGGPVAGTTAFAAGLVIPSIAGQQLPEAMAMIFVGGAVLMSWPTDLSPRQASWSGLLLGLAVLTRPETLLVLPIVGAWILLNAPASVRRRCVATLAASALALLLPWQLWSYRETDTLLPSASLGPTLAGSLTDRTEHGDLLGAWDNAPVLAPPASVALSTSDGDRDRAFRTETWHNLSATSLPTLWVARVLRGWEIWPPQDVVYARQARGLDLPDGAPGAAAECVVSGIAIVTLVMLRRRWRALFPFLALPVLFTIESALLFGDRGLRAWVAPFVVAAAATSVSRVLFPADASSSPHPRDLGFAETASGVRFP